MIRSLRWLIGAGLGVLLAAGCSSPTDQTQQGIVADRPTSPGDGAVARMALPGSPEGISVAPEGFAYVTQPDHGQPAGRVARVDLSCRAIDGEIAVGNLASLIVRN